MSDINVINNNFIIVKDEPGRDGWFTYYEKQDPTYPCGWSNTLSQAHIHMMQRSLNTIFASEALEKTNKKAIITDEQCKFNNGIALTEYVLDTIKATLDNPDNTDYYCVVDYNKFNEIYGITNNDIAFMLNMLRWMRYNVQLNCGSVFISWA